MKKLLNQDLSRRSFIGGTAAVAALGLAACSSSEESGGDTTVTSDTGPAEDEDDEGADAGEVVGTVGGGTITAGSAYAPSSLDPTSTGSAIGLGANWHVLEGLYGIDYHDYSIHAELATADPEQIDEYTYEVSLREGATYSDGTAVTVDDVINTYNETATSDTYAPMIEPITSIEAKDESTLTITCSIPNFSLIKDRLAILRITPASQTADDRASWPIGSGPWMYQTISDTVIELVPNPNYNGSFAVEDEMIHYDILTDSTARLTAQQEASTLVMENLTADSVEILENQGCKIDNVQGFGTRFIMFNVAKAPWDDIHVRQAVMYALNVPQMISNTFAGYASAATCYLPETFTNYHEASTVYTYDPDRAAELLQEAGLTQPGEVKLRCTDNTQASAMAVQAKEDLDALGFNCTIEEDTSASTYAAIDDSRDYDILIAPGDPSCFGADPDLLMTWWFGDNVWMQQRCPWGSSDDWKNFNELRQSALAQSGDEQQATWNECFDMLAEFCVLYPIVHIKTISASWDDPATSPNGVAIEGFEGIGTTSMYFLNTRTVTA